MNEDYQQVEIAAEAEERLRTLAHSTRTVPTPSDSYGMLGELRSSIEHLEQVCRQLGAWHAGLQEGEHFVVDDRRSDGAGTTITATALERGADAINAVSEELSFAHRQRHGALDLVTCSAEARKLEPARSLGRAAHRGSTVLLGSSQPTTVRHPQLRHLHVRWPIVIGPPPHRHAAHPIVCRVDPQPHLGGMGSLHPFGPRRSHSSAMAP